MMQLCPRCFRELRASETAWGTGWRARRARATHSRLDGSQRSTVRGPAEKVRRSGTSRSKDAPRFLATFIASISSLGRLALVAPTCLPAAASLSSYTILSRYTLTMLRALTLRRRPAVTLSPARTPLEQRPLSPDVIAPLPWPAADQVVAAGASER